MCFSHTFHTPHTEEIYVLWREREENLFLIRDRSLIIRQGGLAEKEQKQCKFSMTHPIKVLIFS